MDTIHIYFTCFPLATSSGASSLLSKEGATSHVNASRNNISPTLDGMPENDESIRKRSGSNISGSVDFYLGTKVNTNR